MRKLMLCFSLVSWSSGTMAQGSVNDPEQRVAYAGISVGMGVNYLNAQDIVDLVNTTVTTGERQPDFKSAVVFFMSVSLPVSTSWAVKIDYSFLLGSYTVQGFFGTSEFTFTSHMPTIILHYLMLEEEGYNLRGGPGLGYHFGRLTTDFQTGTARYNGSGPGLLLDLEANTSFGDNLFGYIGVEMRWDFVGALTDEYDMPPSSFSQTDLSFFGVGVKFGFTFYFF